MNDNDTRTLLSGFEEYTRSLIMSHVGTLKREADRAAYIGIFSDFFEVTRCDILKAGVEKVGKYMQVLRERYETEKIRYSTMEKYYKVLSAFCTYACRTAADAKARGLEVNPLLDGFENRFLYFPVKAREEKFAFEKVISLAELDLLIGAADDDLTLASILLAFKCFLKSSDMIALTSEDIGTDEKGNCFLMLHERKEAVKIPKDVKPVLMRLKALGDGYLFRNTRTKQFTQKSLIMRLSKACEAAGIKNYTFNDLRNSAAVFAASNGATAKELKESMLHRSASHSAKLTSLKVNLNPAESYMHINVDVSGKNTSEAGGTE